MPGIEEMKELLVDKAGPLGEMVVEEKVESLGISDNPSEGELKVLITESVLSAITDESKHDEIIEELEEKLLKKTE